MIADGHDIACDCPAPFAHLLDSIFPEGHKDRDLPVSTIIERDYKQWLSGGLDAEETGMAETTEEKDTPGVKQEEEENIIPDDGDVEGLLAAVADAEAR